MNTKSLALLFCLLASPAYADDAAEIAGLLHQFLANADRQEVHATFWAEDLVYTSSRGTRTDKSAILASFEQTGEEESQDEAPPVVYTGEDVDIRLYGEAAVVAFKLVGTPSDGSVPLYYFNTGTLLKRDGKWQVVAWQATKIPGVEDKTD